MYLDKLFKILEVVVKSGAGLTVSDIKLLTYLSQVINLLMI